MKTASPEAALKRRHDDVTEYFRETDRLCAFFTDAAI